MLKTIADALRYRGPAGALFVVLMFLAPIVALGPRLLLSIVADHQNAVAAVMLAGGFLAVLWLIQVRRRRRDGAGTDIPISKWPKLGRDDQWAIRSKLKPIKTSRK